MADSAFRWRWLAVAALVPATLGLGNQLQDVDAAQYADVARRVLEGHWLALHDMNGPFVNKPPLMIWAQAAVMAVTGPTSFGARLPALLFGALATLATFLAGRELRDARFGGCAAALFAGSVAMHHMIADPKVDLALTAMSALSIWAVLASRRRAGFIWLGWLFAALGMLAKGPIGVVLPMLAVGPELVRRSWSEGFAAANVADPIAAPSGQPDEQRSPTRKEGSLVRRVLSVRPLRGALLVAAVVAPFYLATAREAGGDSASLLLWSQSFGRIFGTSGWRDASTPLFFTHTSLWAFLPFSPLLIAALLRRAVGLWRTRSFPGSVERVPLWWFALPFLVISFSSFKLPQYLYWVGPAAALLAADELRVLSEVGHRRWQRGFLALGALLAVLVLAFAWLCFPSHWPWALAALGVTAAGWAATRASADLVARTATLSVTATLGVLAYFHAGLQPAMLEYQPSEKLAEVVRSRDPNGALLPCFDVGPPFSYAFYARREVSQLGADELKREVDAGRVKLAVIADGHSDALRGAGLEVTSLGRYPSYPTSMPRGRFLRASTRPDSLSWVELVELRSLP